MLKMGNHDVGRAMAAGAKGFWAGRGDNPVTPAEAMAALDSIAEEFRGSDAEFDDEFYSETPLSKLVAIAFEATPEQIASRDGENDEDDGEAWYDGVQCKFSERYEFC
jgi:hypothetical protein